MFETGDCDYDQDNILAALEESISHAYSQRKGRFFSVFETKKIIYRILLNKTL